MKYLRITTALISAAVLWSAPKAANAAYIVQTDSPSVEINLDALSGTPAKSNYDPVESVVLSAPSSEYQNPNLYTSNTNNFVTETTVISSDTVPSAPVLQPPSMPTRNLSPVTLRPPQANTTQTRIVSTVPDVVPATPVIQNAYKPAPVVLQEPAVVKSSGPMLAFPTKEREIVDVTTVQTTTVDPVLPPIASAPVVQPRPSFLDVIEQSVDRLAGPSTSPSPNISFNAPLVPEMPAVPVAPVLTPPTTTTIAPQPKQVIVVKEKPVIEPQKVIVKAEPELTPNNTIDLSQVVSVTPAPAPVQMPEPMLVTEPAPVTTQVTTTEVVEVTAPEPMDAPTPDKAPMEPATPTVVALQPEQDDIFVRNNDVQDMDAPTPLNISGEINNLKATPQPVSTEPAVVTKLNAEPEGVKAFKTTKTTRVVTLDKDYFENPQTIENIAPLQEPRDEILNIETISLNDTDEAAPLTPTKSDRAAGSVSAPIGREEDAIPMAVEQPLMANTNADNDLSDSTTLVEVTPPVSDELSLSIDTVDAQPATTTMDIEQQVNPDVIPPVVNNSLQQTASITTDTEPRNISQDKNVVIIPLEPQPIENLPVKDDAIGGYTNMDSDVAVVKAMANTPAPYMQETQPQVLNINSRTPTTAVDSMPFELNIQAPQGRAPAPAFEVAAAKPVSTPIVEKPAPKIEVAQTQPIKTMPKSNMETFKMPAEPVTQVEMFETTVEETGPTDAFEANENGAVTMTVTSVETTYPVIEYSNATSGLTDAQKAGLHDMVNTLQTDSNTRLQLRAYATSSDGSESAARRVALARAIEARKFLMDEGVEATRIDVRALGQDANNTQSPDRIDMVIIE